MTLGECINKYLNDHNMSMRQFAAKAGVSHTYISYLISGRTGRGDAPAPTFEKYRDFARAMGMDVNELIALVDDTIALKETESHGKWMATKDSVKLTDEEFELIAAWRKANIEDKQTAAFALRKYGMPVPMGDSGSNSALLNAFIETVGLA